MRRTVTAVVLDVVGSAAVLVLLSLSWQRVRIDRQPPFADVVVGLSGRTVAPAVFGFAVVALAGAVAALATRGRVRQLVAVVVAAAGGGSIAAALFALQASDDAVARGRAAQAVADRTSATSVVPITDGTVSVAVHDVWPLLCAVAALLVVAAGVLFVLPARSARAPGGLGPRYEAPVAAERPRDLTMWSALDHGEDPTVGTADLTSTTGEHDSDTGADRRPT